MYDVIVVGAGPCGCTAARTLAEKGLSVLLAERCRLPRYKSCSGVLIRKSMELVRRFFGEDVPAAAACAPADNRGMVFTDDKGRSFLFEQEGLNVWRSSFDHWLAEKAKEQGAQLLDGTAAVSCGEKGEYVSVTLRGEGVFAENAKYVLDCEGCIGALKRRLTGGERDYITTYQTFNDGAIDLDPHYFYAYLQPELSEYDAWFNVKDDRLVLGVAVKDTNKIRDYYERFLAYMRANHGLRIDAQLREERWLMPRVRPGCPVDYGRGRVLFAGEAAGFLNPMGEGISAGMESGFLAACAIAGHLDDPAAALAEYREATRLLKSYMERQWSLVAGMAAAFREME
ncbi:MAG: NAD(P)/FAD-dependent oxidoreductase [Lachnospiraceae bacterium]|nr:NAD(P)/FAD-dependent oxidoreductase [Lachnospiraceae bacterium]